MPTIGRKPAEKDISWAWLNQNQARASIMGRVSANGWLVSIGGRTGRSGSTAPTMYYGLYQASGDTVTTRLGVTNGFTASTVMLDHWSGADYIAKTPTPIMLSPGIDYALAILATGAGAAVGQDVSGHRMHTKNAVSSLPNPYSASLAAPEGKLSLWGTIVNNRKPNTPTGLSPVNGGMTTSATPTLGANFTDPDEILTGYTIGQADKVKYYQFEIWNSAKTSRLRNSGKLAASSAQRTARRVTWAPTALAADRYVARVTVWDEFNTPSSTAEWTFTINAGGAWEDVDIRANQYVGSGITNGDGLASTLTARATWSHANGLAASNFRIQLKNEAGTIVRGPSTLTTATAVGALREWHFSGASWAALPRGQRYRLEISGQDSTGLWSPWSAGPLFMVNAYPNTGSFREPFNTAMSSRPTLTAELTDPNDAETTLIPDFMVRLQGDTGSGLRIPESRLYRQDDRWMATTSATEMPTYGIYEWRVRATDPWGLSGDWSTWLSFTYALPPTIAITSPAGTIATGVPQVSWTSSEMMSRFRVLITLASTGAAVYDVTYDRSGMSWTHTVPPGTLRANTDYRVTVTVTSTTGLVGSATSAFRIEYPAALPITNVISDRVPGPFEPEADPDQWSRIRVSWNAATLAMVPDDEFYGYIVRRVDLGTGEDRIVARTMTRSTSVFVDKTPASGVAYRYDVSYLAIRNMLDVTESAVASTQASVTLVNTVVTSLDADDLGAPLRYWDDRSATWNMDREVIPTWGEKPLIFSGAASYLTIRGSFIALDDEYGTYTAREIVLAVQAMASNVTHDDGSIEPRTLFYRDPKGRALAVVMTTGNEDDRHELNVGTINVVFTEVDATLGIDESELIGGF